MSEEATAPTESATDTVPALSAENNDDNLTAKNTSNSNTSNKKESTDSNSNSPSKGTATNMSNTNNSSGGKSSKKRARNQESSSSNNAITNTLIHNLQSILLELTNEHNNVSSISGANTTLPVSNVFSINTNTSTSLSSKNTNLSLPTLENVIPNITKAINDTPPWVHLSHRDSAPQLKIDDTRKRLSVKGGGSNPNASSASADKNSSGSGSNTSGGVSTSGGTSSSTSSSGGNTNDSILRGYRMVRASHGLSEGTAFFEVFVYAPPSAHEMVSSLPAHVRLGEKLQDQLKEKIIYEQEQQQKLQQNSSSQDDTQSQSTSTATNVAPPLAKKQKISSQLDTSHASYISDLQTKLYHKQKQMLGGHVRLGWSMRTGELQAPVGYDRWSYGIRDIMASKIHNSQRQDSWAGGALASFGPGDIIGIAISLKGSNGGAGTSTSASGAASGNTTNANIGATGSGSGSVGTTNANVSDNTASATNTNKKRKETQPPTNEIRFFKNGLSLGQILVSRNVRSGGAAFENIQDGTYYPAVSVFMGGNVRVNFGPHFVYPIQTSQLPSGMKKLRPMSDLCPPPKDPDDVVQWAMKEKEKIYPKGKGGSASSTNASDMDAIVNAFKELVKTDAIMRYEAYENHLKSHIEEIKRARQERGLSTNIG